MALPLLSMGLLMLSSVRLASLWRRKDVRLVGNSCESLVRTTAAADDGEDRTKRRARGCLGCYMRAGLQKWKMEVVVGCVGRARKKGKWRETPMAESRSSFSLVFDQKRQGGGRL